MRPGYKVAIPLLIAVFWFGMEMGIAQQTSDTATGAPPDTTLKALLEQYDIPVRQVVRTFGKKKFEGLRRRYSAISGVVMVGVVNRRDEVLLAGPPWSPPGGVVQTNEGWPAAARRIIREKTGIRIAAPEPVRVEQMVIRQRQAERRSFKAYVVHFKARPARGSVYVCRDFWKRAATQYRWFKTVPDAVDPNHRGHVALYLD